MPSVKKMNTLRYQILYHSPMFPVRTIALMTLALACAFSATAVAGAILFPSFLPLAVSSPSALRPSPSPLPSPLPTNLLFVGDIMLARGVEWRIGKEGIDYPLADVTSLIAGADLAIGNFEGTIRNEPNQELDGFTFDTTPAISQMVRNAGFDVLSLSNNHSDNYGSAVVQSTRETLAAQGFTVFGDPYESERFVAHAEHSGISFAFIGFHAFGEDPESILPVIASENAAGHFVIVYPHWGNEYQFTPSAAQTEAAHQFVDAGADAIIGAHPHVIQTYENYRGVPIIYSLGNFLFDQDWSVPTQQGLALNFSVDETNITMTFIPISVIKSHVTLMNAEDASGILAEHGLPATLKIVRPINQNAPVQQ